jgi:hypothetical protein
MERAAGEANEKECAVSGDTPTKEGLEEATMEHGPATGAAGVVDRYHGLSALSDMLKTKRDQADPTTPPPPAFPMVVSMATPNGSNSINVVHG